MTPKIHSFSQMAKFHGFQLSSFLYGAIMYLIFLKYDFFESQLLSTLLKCLPIFALMTFLLMNDFKEQKQAQHKKRLLTALFFSLIGDILLDYKAGGDDAFAIGMVSFAITQITYSTTFGFENLKPFLGISIYALGASVMLFLFKHFTDIFVFAVPLYSILLETTAWRAISRVQNTKSMPQVFCAVGAVLFVISDSIICFDMFYQTIPNAQFYIIITYYLAQLGLTASILDLPIESKKNR